MASNSESEPVLPIAEEPRPQCNLGTIRDLRAHVKSATSVPIDGTLPVVVDDGKRRKVAVGMMDEFDQIKATEGDRYAATLPGFFWEQRARQVVDDAIDAHTGGGVRLDEATYRTQIIAALQRCKDELRKQRADARDAALQAEAGAQLELLEDDNYFDAWVHAHRRCRNHACYAARAMPPNCYLA